MSPPTVSAPRVSHALYRRLTGPAALSERATTPLISACDLPGPENETVEANRLSVFVVGRVGAGTQPTLDRTPA